MELLRSHGIAIDDFRRKSEHKNQLFLLSHSHMDHIDWRRMALWSKPIFCSRTTLALLQPELPHVTFKHLTSKRPCREGQIDVQAVRTFHSPGSRGFFFPRWGVLFLGDTRLVPRLERWIRSVRPKTVITDKTHVHYSMPSVAESLLQVILYLTNFLQSHLRPVFYIGVAHAGTLLLLRLLRIRCRTEGKLPRFVPELLQRYALIDPRSVIVLVPLRDPRANLLPTSLFFTSRQDADMSSACSDESHCRFVWSLHMSMEEFVRLQSMVKEVELV